MKKLAGLFIIFNIALLLAIPCWAAGTVSQAVTTIYEGESVPKVRVLTFTATADAADGSYPSTAMSAATLSKLKGWYLYKVITNPGSTAPTDNWDFTLSDTDGIDVLGGNGANRHTTTSQMIAPLLTTGVYFAQPVLNAWTLAITGNSNNSAGIVIQCVFVR